MGTRDGHVIGFGVRQPQPSRHSATLRLKIPVTFIPTRKGMFTGVYRLTWTDRLGTHTLAVPLTGTGA